MSRRLKITLPEAVATQLDELVANTGEPAARLAGQMVRQGIVEAASGGDVRPPRVELAPVLPDARENREPDQRAPWFEPYGGDREWRVRVKIEALLLDDDTELSPERSALL